MSTADTAMRLAADLLRLCDKPGGDTHTLGPATAGHYCTRCEQDTALAADVLALTTDGIKSIALFVHCPTCDTGETP